MGIIAGIVLVVRQFAFSSDPDLLAATRRGDTDAFAILYDRYHSRMSRLCEQMLDDAGAAEDVVQSVFISIWKAPPQLEYGSFSSWLTCVTKNRVRDAMRARSARREAAWPEHLTVPDSLDEEVYERLERVRMRHALSTLPEAQRKVIELSFLGERSHAELAELLSLPLGTVKTRIRAGLQKLRFELGAGIHGLADGITAS